MWPRVKDKLSAYRRRKPIEELVRKAKKAKRKGIWTQEEVDLAIAEGERLSKLFQHE